MARPRFSEMLVDRRRELGLSIKQAANVLRLREDVLMAFEDGDFQMMPKSGYAQGMLSSYARYLGLNPRMVTAQFSADLADWEHGGSGRQIAGRGGSRRGSGGEGPSYELPGEGSGGGRYEGSRGLLPTSGGYAGDVYGYTTTRASARGQGSTPLVSSRSAARGDIIPRRYSGRDMSNYSSGRDGGRSSRYRQQADRSGYASRYRGSEGYADRSSRDRVSVRRVNPSEYRDDLRYDNARPYEAASTLSGRQSSRNIARTDRPNVARRRPIEDPRRYNRARRNPKPPRGGVMGVIEAFFSDSRRAIGFGLVACAVILTVVVISSINSCVSKGASGSKTVEVSSSSTQTQSQSKPSDSSPGSSDSNSKEEEEAAAEAVAAKNEKDEQDANTETDVVVSVEDGEVSWVEIECDGKSEVAEQITGPWKKSFVVTDSITVQVSNTSAVTVKKNGETQKFDNKTSGIGTVTIAGTKVATKSDDASDGSDASVTSSGDSSSTSSSGSKSATASSAKGSKKTGSSSQKN